MITFLAGLALGLAAGRVIVAGIPTGPAAVDLVVTVALAVAIILERRK